MLAMALFLPALLLEPELLAISLGIAAAALIAVEVLRVGRCPLVGAQIDKFMTAFIDSRDRGLLLISHFSLLIGMAVPLWLTLPFIEADSRATMHIPGGGSTSEGHGCTRAPAAAFAGIMILGVADSAASAVGRRFGRHRLLQTHKSLEGTAGGVLFTLLGWALLAAVMCFLGGSSAWHAVHGIGGVRWSRLAVAVVGSCLLEAVTTQLDNIFLPLHHLACLL